MARRLLPAVVLAVSVCGHALPATKIVDVGPGGALVFRDEETGTANTTINAGDTVQWVWKSSGHSTTSDRPQDGWNSNVQDAPFTFTHTFPMPGNYPYHCIPHQAFGMVGEVVVRGTGTATTTTTIPGVPCADEAAVAAARAQIDAQCPCTTARNHGAYVRCAVHVLSRAVKAGMLPAACKGGVKQCAARSVCGRAGFVTCCRTTAADRTRCSIKRAAAACRAPKGGTACAGTRSSCCDACAATGCGP